MRDVSGLGILGLAVDQPAVVSCITGNDVEGPTGGQCGMGIELESPCMKRTGPEDAELSPSWGVCEGDEGGLNGGGIGRGIVIDAGRSCDDVQGPW